MMERTMNRIVAVAAIVLIAGAGAGPALSQDDAAAPTARQVVDRYIEALGGEQAIRSHDAMVMTGTMEIPGQGMTAEMKIMAMAPDKMKMEITLPGMGSIQSGFDGEVGWSMNPMTGPMVMEGKELAQTRRQADFYSSLHGDHLYKSMTNSGKVDFQGNPCWKIDLVTTEGDAITEYYNVETGLIDGITQTQESQMGEINITTLTSEYKEFGGILAPTKMSARLGPGMEQTFTIQNIAFEGVTADDFTLPASIQALVGGGEEQAAPEAPAPPAVENLNRED